MSFFCVWPFATAFDPARWTFCLTTPYDIICRLQQLKTILIESWSRSRLSMIRIDLKGVTKVKAKGRVYYYAWRGGPRLSGRPGTPEFVASYNEAIESRKAI
jgi:hypothetical protein